MLLERAKTENNPHFKKDLMGNLWCIHTIESLLNAHKVTQIS